MKTAFSRALWVSVLAAAAATSVSAAPAADIEKTCVQKIDELLPGMGSPTIVDRREPQLAFERICFQASGPGKDAEREALSKAIMTRVGPEIAKPARVWLLRKIEPLGREEVVAGLVRLFQDNDPEIRDLARRALQNNPSPGAAAALRSELQKAQAGPWRVALINALGFRKDADSVVMLSTLAGDGDDAVAGAAIAALADIGTDPAIKTLTDLRKSGSPQRHDAVVDACLRAAEHLRARGKTDQAASIYEELLGASEAEAIRIAALHGLTAARGSDALPRLMQFINGPDSRMQLVAARCAQDLGLKVTSQLTSALDGASPSAAAVLLDVLGQRGDPAALPAVVKKGDDREAEVRIAALDALKYLGDRSVVLLLAERAAKTTNEERDTAFRSLASLRAPGVDEAVVQAMDGAGAGAAVRAELIKAATARRIKSAMPRFLAAAGDPDQGVRVAAWAALGAFATEKDLPHLVELLVKAEGHDALKAAEEGISNICSRLTDPEQAVAPVAAALPRAGAPAKASLVRVLGQVQGDRALEAVLAQCKAPDDVVKDAAVAVLAEWKTPAAMDGLLDIAKAGTPAQRELALRGYVRLAGLPSEREPAATYELLKNAMALAAGGEDRKLVLAAMATVPHLDAMSFAAGYLDDPAMRAEAAAAVLAVAVGVSGQYPDEAVAAIRRVHDAGPDDAMRARAGKALDSLGRYCTSWLLSGPYKKRGKGGGDLFDVPFPPEDPQARADWRRLTVTNLDQLGRFDLGKDNDCCAYVRTAVWADQAQQAVLSIGSDDGVKVWLNGAVVHANNASRGLTRDQDKAAVQLNAGWNTLLMKITQGGGEWEFCCAVQALDGGRIKGLKLEAK